MLFLFSDVGPNDAPTRIRAGSHIDIATLLAPLGLNGLSLRELAANGFVESAARRQILATGEAGTVYLCHPFLVHAAQPIAAPARVFSPSLRYCLPSLSHLSARAVDIRPSSRLSGWL
jgi:hypothetical protein